MQDYISDDKERWSIKEDLEEALSGVNELEIIDHPQSKFLYDPKEFE